MIIALDTLFAAAAQGPSLPSPAPPRAPLTYHPTAGVQHMLLGMPPRPPQLAHRSARVPPAALFHKIKGGPSPAGARRSRGTSSAHLGPSAPLAYLPPLTATVCSPRVTYEGATPIRSRAAKTRRTSRRSGPSRSARTRAKQYVPPQDVPGGLHAWRQGMCVQLHGDASFTGQGVVMESLGLSACLLLVLVDRSTDGVCAGNLRTSPLAAACTSSVKYVP